MKINHPLMHNNFLKSDMNCSKKINKNKDLILTQSKKVSEFEKNGLNGLVLNIVCL